MNRTIGLIGSFLVTVATLGFALSLLIGSPTLSYGTSMAIALGYVLLASAVCAESPPSRNGSAYVAVALAGAYALLVSVVYFAQLTAVAHGGLSPEALAILSYASPGSLMFSLDLLGCAFMALSTLFAGLTIVPTSTGDRWLKVLLIAHGLFAPGCVLLPILVVPDATKPGGDSFGVVALLVWCAYFTPVGLLSFRHFWLRQAMAADRITLI